MRDKKDKPIKLSTIKDGKLIKQSDNALWSFDVTLRIFLRDSIRRFAQTIHSYPDCFDENWNEITTEEWEGRDNDKDYYKAWIDHLNGIADKLDYSLTDEWESLSSQDNEVLRCIREKYPGGLLFDRDKMSEEETATIKNIFTKMIEEKKKRLDAGQEAIDDIRKILYHLWD